MDIIEDFECLTYQPRTAETCEVYEHVISAIHTALSLSKKITDYGAEDETMADPDMEHGYWNRRIGRRCGL
jgi:hypothetical protein